MCRREQKDSKCLKVNLQLNPELQQYNTRRREGAGPSQVRSARRHTPGEVASVEKDRVQVALPRIHGPIASSAFHCGADHSILGAFTSSARHTAPTGDSGACTRPLSRTAQSHTPHAPAATRAASSASPSTPIVGTRIVFYAFHGHRRAFATQSPTNKFWGVPNGKTSLKHKRDTYRRTGMWLFCRRACLPRAASTESSCA
jgi:hypothetical protein